MQNPKKPPAPSSPSLRKQVTESWQSSVLAFNLIGITWQNPSEVPKEFGELKAICNGSFDCFPHATARLVWFSLNFPIPQEYFKFAVVAWQVLILHCFISSEVSSAFLKGSISQWWHFPILYSFCVVVHTGRKEKASLKIYVHIQHVTDSTYACLAQVFLFMVLLFGAVCRNLGKFLSCGCSRVE